MSHIIYPHGTLTELREHLNYDMTIVSDKNNFKIHYFKTAAREIARVKCMKIPFF